MESSSHPTVLESNPVTWVEACLSVPRSSDSRWCCWAVVSTHSCTELCSLHPLPSFSEEAPRSRKMAKWGHESWRKKHLVGQSLLQSFVSTIILYFPLPLRFQASQLVFLFKQLRTPDGRVGGGGGPAKGRKGTSRGCGWRGKVLKHAVQGKCQTGLQRQERRKER